MFEMRWVSDRDGNLQLQQRSRGFQVDASGAFCGLTAWSDWAAVPIVHMWFNQEKNANDQSVAASGWLTDPT